MSKGKPYRTIKFDGFHILVGKGDYENDQLTFDVAQPDDFWLHVAGYGGSHVIIRNPESLAGIPREVALRAAELSAWYSKARGSRGKVEVHMCRASDVSKPPSFEPGKVMLDRFTVLKVYPKGPESPRSDPASAP